MRSSRRARGDSRPVWFPFTSEMGSPAADMHEVSRKARCAVGAALRALPSSSNIRGQRRTSHSSRRVSADTFAPVTGWGWRRSVVLVMYLLTSSSAISQDTASGRLPGFSFTCRMSTDGRPSPFHSSGSRPMDSTWASRASFHAWRITGRGVNFINRRRCP